MTTKFTVVVSTDFAGEAMLNLVKSIDEQTLPYSDFEVVFAHGKSGPSSMNRLVPLARNRPNVVLRTPESIAEGSWGVTQGEFILILNPAVQGPAVQLAPAALERLFEYASENGTDVLFGRSVNSDLSVPPDKLFLNNQAELMPETTSQALSQACVVVRRSFLVDNDVAITSEVAIDWPVDLGRVAVFADYPCLLNVELGGSRALEGSKAPEIDQPKLTWVDAQLRIDVSATLSGAPQDEIQEESIRCSIRHIGSGLDFWLPTTSEIVASDDYPMMSIRAHIDVLRVDTGEPLDEGVWQVLLHLPGCSAPVPAADADCAIIDGTFVVPCRTKSGLGLDVGATTASVVGRMHPSNTEVRDSAAGTRLTMNLPKVHIHGSSETSGTVMLGKFRLPGRLITDGQFARVECYLSGLAGTSALSTQFGAASPAPTDLMLNILRSGMMTVEKTSPPKPRSTTSASPAMAESRPRVNQQAAEKAKETTRANANQARQGFVARLRRRVPNRFEPVIKVVSRNGIAKRLYRQLTKS